MAEPNWYRGGSKRKRWTVYNNKTDMPVMIYGTAQECAKAMGLTLGAFFQTVYKVRKGKLKKWYIEEEEVVESETV